MVEQHFKNGLIRVEASPGSLLILNIIDVINNCTQVGDKVMLTAQYVINVFSFLKLR